MQLWLLLERSRSDKTYDMDEEGDSSVNGEQIFTCLEFGSEKRPGSNLCGWEDGQPLQELRALPSCATPGLVLCLEAEDMWLSVCSFEVAWQKGRI